MKFKKIISGILSLTLILGVCSISAFAAENTSGCYVVTEETPEEILEYAKRGVPRISLPSFKVLTELMREKHNILWAILLIFKNLMVLTEFTIFLLWKMVKFLQCSPSMTKMVNITHSLTKI